MKTIAALLSLLAAAAPVAADDTATPPATVELSYQMAVGADGRPTALTPLRTLPPAVEAWVQERVRGFVFQPATANGQPQPATTTLYLTLRQVQTADGKPGYAISSASTGPRLVKGRLESRPRTSGAGYFRIHFDATGKVIQAEPADLPFVGDAGFRKWGLALVRSFRLEPETVAGRGVADEALVPVLYCLGKCPVLPAPPPEAGAALDEGLVAHSVLGSAPAGS